MSTLTICLPEDLSIRLKNVAEARGISLNKFITEISIQALTVYDAELRFKAMVARADINAALGVLERLDSQN